MGNEYCYRPSERPLGSSIFLVETNLNTRDDNSSFSKQENQFPTKQTIEDHNEKFKNEGINIIDKENTIESNNSKPFFREVIINSRIRFPGN